MRKQPTVALSSTEAEYMACTESCKKAIWIKRLYNEICLLSESSISPPIPQLIRIDNQSALKLAKNPIQHGQTKHIDIWHHFIRKCVENSIVHLEYVKSEENTADVLTKPLPRPDHERHMLELGVRALSD